MHKLSFDKTIERFDLIISDMNDAERENNLMFRRICKEIFQKAYSDIQFQKHQDIIDKKFHMGITCIIKNARGHYKKSSLRKSFRKLNSQNHVITYSDLHKINLFLRTSEFTLVLKLLKIQYKYGLNEAISFTNSH